MKLAARWLTRLTTPLLLVGFLAAWKAYVVVFNVSPFILPPPEAVLSGLVHVLREDLILTHIRVTLTETLLGFVIACAIGIGLGVVLGKVRWLEQSVNPFIVATQVVPKIALVPLFIMWFGFGLTSKVVIAAVLAFFPILTNTMLGIKSMEPGHKDVMASINATRWDSFWALDLPSALPYILTGMEVGIVLATIGAVVGEYLGGNEGLGHLAVDTMAAFEVDALFGVIVLLTLLGFALHMSIVGLSRLLIPWHQSAIIRPQKERT